MLKALQLSKKTAVFQMYIKGWWVKWQAILDLLLKYFWKKEKIKRIDEAVFKTFDYWYIWVMNI